MNRTQIFNQGDFAFNTFTFNDDGMVINLRIIQHTHHGYRIIRFITEIDSNTSTRPFFIQELAQRFTAVFNPIQRDHGFLA
ncbi:hypothetical protein DKS90_24965 [Salmonella enterica subsp. enterica serovar Muenchen]|nr:hypothetical protein [Salmonella enterica subsp. enterica serovar Muenchen]